MSKQTAFKKIAGFILVCALNSCASGPSKNMVASWYGRPSHKEMTASGEACNMSNYTAAHRTLPLGTILEVYNPANHKTIRVTVNDRGPYIRGRDLDLSYGAAKALNITQEGIASLQVRKVGFDERYKEYHKNSHIQKL